MDERTPSEIVSKELSRQDLLNPDYEHWGRMEVWSLHETIHLAQGIKPAMEAVHIYSVLHDTLRSIGGPFRADDRNDHYEMMVFEILKPDQEAMSKTRTLLVRAHKTVFSKPGYEENQFHPADFVKWAIARKLKVPNQLVEAVKKYHSDKFKESVEANIENSQEHLLSREESQELGRLRREKKKWDKSLEAAIHAALFFQGKKLTRKNLSEELYKFGLPDASLEIIWKGLREKGLTKDAGRPKKEKNP
jgi:hypothetical protein